MKKVNGSTLAVLAVLVTLALVFTFLLSSRLLRQAPSAEAPISTVSLGSSASPLISPLNTPQFQPEDLLPATSTTGPAITPRAFPAVAVTPPPADKTQPANITTLWYAAYPASGSELTLHGVGVDANGQQWSEKALGKSIDLGVSPRPPGFVGGFPTLLDFSPSTDGAWVLEAIDYRPPLLINMATGEVQEVKSYQHNGGAGAFAWLPDNRHFVALPLDIPGDVTAPSVDGTPAMVIPFPGEGTLTNTGTLVGLAYSPDGKQLLDAINVQPAYQVREYPQIQIGVRTSEQGERKIVLELKQAVLVLGSLRWLASDRIVFIANVYSTDKPPFWTDNVESQLWQLDLISGQAKMVALLGKKVEYEHQPAQVGIGAVLVITVDAVQAGKETANSLHLISLGNEGQKTIVQLQGKRVSSPGLSPDGKWVAFVVSDGEYGQIWLTTTDGLYQHAIAGPTSLNAPIFWTK